MTDLAPTQNETQMNTDNDKSGSPENGQITAEETTNERAQEIETSAVDKKQLRNEEEIVKEPRLATPEKEDSDAEVTNPHVPESSEQKQSNSKLNGSSKTVENSHGESKKVDENHNEKLKDEKTKCSETDVCKEIPGSSGSTIRHGIEMLTQGHHYFTSRMKKHQSCVFKANLFGCPFVSITDHQGIQCLFDTEKFEKEPAFGNFKLNKQLVDQHIPSMFRNGETHAKQKEFLISMSKHLTLKKLLPVAMRIIPEHLSKWQFKTDLGTESQEKWEEKILLLTSDIMSEAILGSRQDGQCFLDWRFQVLMPENLSRGFTLRLSESVLKLRCISDSNQQRFITLEQTQESKDCVDDLQSLREKLWVLWRICETVADCPNIEKIIEQAAKYGINEQEAIMDVLWMMNFNAAPGTGAAIRSAIARVSILPEEEKNILKDEIKNCLGTEGLNYQTLKKMKMLDNFILEVLRMHPPVAMYFGIAKDDVIIESKTGKYKVKAGQRVLGSCHLAQRDPAVFSNSTYKTPEEFDYNRFNEKGMKKKLLCSHGLLKDKPSPHNHSCAGYFAGILTTKIFIMYLILFCDWELEEKPYWTDKSLIRYGNPDEPVRLKNFNYTRDKKKLLIPDDKENDSSSSSDEGEIYSSDSDSDIDKKRDNMSVSDLVA